MIVGEISDVKLFLCFQFISDLEQGVVKPLVLPASDEPQFDNLVKGVIKKEAQLDDEAMDTSSSSTASPVTEK